MAKSTFALTVEVKNKVEAARDVMSFELVDPFGRDLPTFTAGAHLDVKIGENLVRQYSLYNHPQESHRYCLGILKEPNSRGGSIGMHERIAQGDFIQISAPRNHFELVPEAKRSLLFAGGIGITPIYAMAQQLTSTQQSFAFHYAARSDDRMAFHDEIAESEFAEKAKFYFDDQPHLGKLDVSSIASHEQQEGTHVYVCGPGGFIDYVINSFKQAGWDQTQLHTEYFVGDETSDTENTSFEVEIASTGEVFKIAADERITDVLFDNDVDVLTSCEQGICGTCITKIIDGVPDHRDKYLTDEEKASNKIFTPCCSRAKSGRLVLDL